MPIADGTVLQPGLLILRGAVNTGVLQSGDRAWLIDCCDSVTPERLTALGIRRVERILATQHRRLNLMGADRFIAGGARLVVPEAERRLIEQVEDYWSDPRWRWHLYRFQPGPLVLPWSLTVDRNAVDGESLDWRGFRVSVLATPGASEGAVSYLVEVEGRRVCFCGDVLCGTGQVPDLYSLQKGEGFGVGDYHGFVGMRAALYRSLERLGNCGADTLVPSRGEPVAAPAEATRLTRGRLEELFTLYSEVSSIHHYFPGGLPATPARLPPVPTLPVPECVRNVDYTSWALVSDSGAALVLDCPRSATVTTLRDWLARGTIRHVEAAWVTHYHDDHVDGMPELQRAFGCPVITDEHLAEVIEHPERFCLPAQSPLPCPVARATRHGDSWDWHEFRFTALHWPGQTHHGAGLLAEGHGLRMLFAGDSFSPCGIDDYCCGNRNPPGAGRGYRRCLDLLRELHPDLIFNPHQAAPFRFDEGALVRIEANLVAREALLAALLPGDTPAFGLDEWWVRTYPYEQTARAGGPVDLAVFFTNYGRRAVAAVQAVVPDGWVADGAAWQEGDVAAGEEGRIALRLTVPRDARPGQVVIPVRIRWNGRYLGAFRHAIVHVAPERR